MISSNDKAKGKIAVVGTSAIFPGSTHSGEFWKAVINGKDFITDVPTSHWLSEDYYDPEGKSQNKVTSKKGAFLSDLDFDPTLFGIPPKTLTSIDTVQLLSLLAARSLLEQTLSLKSEKINRKNISVILGVAAGSELIGSMSAKIQTPIWIKALREHGLPESQVQSICQSISDSYVPWNENTFPGLLANVVAGRIANRLDLGGTNCTVDAACASSLAAISMAVEQLRAGHSDMVIAGGSDALNDIFMFMCFSKTMALSRSGDCRPFSDHADGTVLGEGIGLVGLRRLEDAKRDGDSIWAIINSVGSSSDGKAKSIYAPVPEGQALAIERAYQDLDYNLSEVELIEAHGTGTAAGDAAEFKGLQMAFAQAGAHKRASCALGSIKSQIGHTKSAAGAAGLIKAIMSLHHKVLPPTLKVERLNPALEIANSPLYINTMARPWIHPTQSARKAGVSSFGFGGSNFHVAVEEYTEDKNQALRFHQSLQELILISCHDPSDMEHKLASLKIDLQQGSWANIARKTQCDFQADAPLRLALLIENEDQAAKLIDYSLKQIHANPEKEFSLINQAYYGLGTTKKRIAFLFPGQGSQYIGMGKELAMEFNVCRQVWDQLAEASQRKQGDLQQSLPLHEVIYPAKAFDQTKEQEQAMRLTQTQWAQPGIGAVCLSHLALLEKIKLRPDCVAGHSYGELPALFAAGVIQSPQALMDISYKRGSLMNQVSDQPGAMSAVNHSISALQALLQETGASVTLANINSPNQSVVSGELDEIEKLEKIFVEKKISYKRLQVATAFHSKMLEGSVKPFDDYLKKTGLTSPSIPIYANSTGQPYPSDQQAILSLLANQLAKPVWFEKQIIVMHEQETIDIFLELGPGNILAPLVHDCLAGKKHSALSLDGSKQQDGLTAWWQSLGQLSAAGVPLDYAALWQDMALAPQVTVPTKSTVKINGSNYGKLYPPKEGAAGLPKPNPEIRKDKHQAEPMDLAHTKQEAGFNQSAPAGYSDQQLQEFQKNIIDAQTTFQETLKASHLAFLKTSESLLANIKGESPAGAPVSQAFASQVKTKIDSKNQDQPIERQPIKSVAQPVPQQQDSETITDQTSINISNLKSLLLAVVADKTGYPEDMLELDMDLESGLGIDSIKRVEILSALQEQVPLLKERDTSELAGLNSLAAILDFVEKVNPTKRAGDQQVKPEQKLSLDFQSILLAVVADKTGYPEDMLELDMDLESGLGIDSIKRVEILSALQEQVPTLKEHDTSALAGLNSLGAIIDFAKKVHPENPSSDQPGEAEKTNVLDLQAILLAVVADKTGYPEEMLTLDMELESGLGIDSIKRVEILSALQEQVPALKERDTSELAGLSTLGAIIEFSKKSGSSEQAPGHKSDGSEPEKPKEIELDKKLYHYQIIHQPVKAVGWGMKGLSSDHPIWIIKDNLGVAKLLASKLTKLGIKTIVTDECSRAQGKIIYLKGISCFNDQDELDSMLALNKEAFQLARQVGPKLIQEKGLLILVQDTASDGVEGNQQSLRSWSGGLSALVKTASQEWPDVAVKTIDLTCAQRTPEELAQTLFDELIGGGPELAVIFNNHGTRLIPTAKLVERNKGSHKLSSDTILVVSGGGRGVTAACLKELVKQQGPIKLAVLGRTALQSEPAKLSTCQTESALKQAVLQAHQATGKKIKPIELEREVRFILANREINKNLEELKALGAQVAYYPVDIVDRPALDQVIQAVRTNWGNITGLIHGAGVLADKAIVDKTDAQFNRVFETKVIGLKNLLHVTDQDDLSLLCCFSSVAAWTGNKGQADYAMANEIVNKVCLSEYKKRDGQCVVKSIGWGPWAGGMVNPALQTHFKAQGLELIPLLEGAQAFVDELMQSNDESVEVLVGGDIHQWTYRQSQAEQISAGELWIQVDRYPQLKSHVIKDKPVVPIMVISQWCQQLALVRYPGKKVLATKQLKVLKGMILQNYYSTGDCFIWSCQEKAVLNKIQLTFKLSSPRGINHYSLMVELGDQAEQLNLKITSRDKGLVQSWDWDRDLVYRSKLFHGKDFQVIKKLTNISQAFCGAILENKSGFMMNGRLSNTALLDGGLQVARLWTDFHEHIKVLPLGFENMVIDSEYWGHDEIRCEYYMVERDSHKSRGHIYFINNENRLVGQISGVEMFAYELLSGKRA